MEIYGTDGFVESCYNVGNITGYGKDGGTVGKGGIVGYNYNGTIKNCYNVGTIEEEAGYYGGICGALGEEKVVNCYYLEDKKANEPGGTSLSSAQMKTKDFVDLLNGKSGKPFKPDDHHINNGYPVLNW